MDETRDADVQCPICMMHAADDDQLEDHIVEVHEQSATPEMRASYEERHRGEDQGPPLP